MSAYALLDENTRVLEERKHELDNELLLRLKLAGKSLAQLCQQHKVVEDHAVVLVVLQAATAIQAKATSVCVCVCMCVCVCVEFGDSACYCFCQWASGNSRRCCRVVGR